MGAVALTEFMQICGAHLHETLLRLPHLTVLGQDSPRSHNQSAWHLLILNTFWHATEPMHGDLPVDLAPG